MESDGEDLDNIFDEYEHNENDTGADNAENGQTTNETPAAVKIAPPKRIVKNPRLKFNPERLCGERGIPVLVDHFKDVKFKGIGHEKEDLDKLLSKLEHWTHRLFPSMKFQDCLNQIEKLGKKRPVQTCLSKIRLGMPILNSDFVKDDEDDVQRNDDPEPEEIDAFDRLIEESQDIMNSNISTTENVDDLSTLHTTPVPNHTEGHVLGSSFGSSITEEQKERMERNRMLAAERRKARLSSLQQNSAESQSAFHEIVPSQNMSVQNSFDKLLNSSSQNQDNAQNTDDVFAMETSLEDNESAKVSPLEVHNESSENLGLDDLIDLVNEEEPIPDKNSAFSSEQVDIISSGDNSNTFFQKENQKDNYLDLEQNDNVNVSDDSDKMIPVLETSKTMDEENLKLESCLDLVDKDSTDCQQNSDLSCLTKNSSVHDCEKEIVDLDSNNELTVMDCENENS